MDVSLSNRYFTIYAHEWNDVFADFTWTHQMLKSITIMNTIGTDEFH